MNVWTAVKSCFRQYVGFSGRAPRSEYWLWVLFCGVVSALLHGLEGGAAQGTPGPIGSAWSLATFLPGMAVAARRLHDTERSGWWLALPLAVMAVLGVAVGAVMLEMQGVGGKVSPELVAAMGPRLVALLFAGAAWLVVVALFLVWFCSRGTAGQNRYGADPLAAQAPA
jgi:uncharacterized membrane protein YhaH (DUF805 family)